MSKGEVQSGAASNTLEEAAALGWLKQEVVWDMEQGTKTKEQDMEQNSPRGKSPQDTRRALS